MQNEFLREIKGFKVRETFASFPCNTAVQSWWQAEQLVVCYAISKDRKVSFYSLFLQKIIFNFYYNIEQASSLVLTARLHSRCECHCNKGNLKSLTSKNISYFYTAHFGERGSGHLQTIARILFSALQGSAQPCSLTVPICPEPRQKHAGSSAPMKSSCCLKSHPVH